MKHKMIYGLAILLALTFVAAPADAAPPSPTNHLVLPFAASNTVTNGDMLTEVSAVGNLCDRDIAVRWALRADKGYKPIIDGEEELGPWEVLTQNFRDLLLEAGHELGADPENLFATYSSRDACLGIGDSFSLDASAFSGTNLFSSRGECRVCDTRAARWVNSEHVTGALIIQWQPRPFSGNTFRITGRTEDGVVVDTLVRKDLMWTNYIQFDDLGFPPDFNFGSLEVECPDYTCYIGVEYFTRVADTEGNPLRRERVDAWGTCHPPVPRPPVVPECEPTQVDVFAGDLNCVVGQTDDVVLKVTGSDPIVPSVKDDEEILPGVFFRDQGMNTYVIDCTPAEEAGEANIAFSNACGDAPVTFTVTETPPPPCIPMTYQVIGETTYKVGDEFDALVSITSGTLPVSVDDSDLPPGGDVTKVNESTFDIDGIAEVVDEGPAIFRNGCSEFEINIVVERDPADPVEPLQLTSECRNNEEGTATWFTKNLNPFPVDFSWHFAGGGATGNETAAAAGQGEVLPWAPERGANYTFFTTPQIGTLIIEWLDENGATQSTVKATNTKECEQEPPEECDDCEGKITNMTLRYTGSGCANVEARIEPDQRFDNSTVFGPAEVCNGETFAMTGQPSSSPGFDGTLGTNLELYVGEVLHGSIHTSCSVEVGPGYTAGDFTVVEAESQHGGPLCPLD